MSVIVKITCDKRDCGNEVKEELVWRVEGPELPPYYFCSWDHAREGMNEIMGVSARSEVDVQRQDPENGEVETPSEDNPPRMPIPPPMDGGPVNRNLVNLVWMYPHDAFRVKPRTK